MLCSSLARHAGFALCLSFFSALLSVLCVSALSFSESFLSTVNCRLSTPLKLDDKVRLADRFERYFNRPRFLALQLHADFPIRKTRQPPFKKLRFAHRLAGRNLRQPPSKPLEIRRLLQRPVHPRRTHLQRVPSWARYQFLDIEDHAQLLADELAIGVADLRVRITRGILAAQVSRRIADCRCWLRNPIDVHPQEPLLADFPLDINDFQAFRARHPLGSAADLF